MKNAYPIGGLCVFAFARGCPGIGRYDAIAQQFNFHTPFDYEPMPALRVSTTPQLWVLGSDDLEAPGPETAKRIKSLIAQGEDYTLAVYPGAEHGMTQYELNANSERVSTRFALGYFQMMAD